MPGGGREGEREETRGLIDAKPISYCRRSAGKSLCFVCTFVCDLKKLALAKVAGHVCVTDFIRNGLDELVLGAGMLFPLGMDLAGLQIEYSTVSRPGRSSNL